MIYSRSGWNGGKLACLLGCSVTFPLGNDDYRYAFTKSKERRGKLPRNINLGCRRKYLPPADTTCLNLNSGFSADKVKSFEAFDKMGIPHPRLISAKSLADRSDSVPNFFLGRKNQSSSGRGIIKYSPESWRKARRSPTWRGHDFYVEFLEFKSEHRIHVFMGRDICYLNKEVKPDSTNFIHTLEQGSQLTIGPIRAPFALASKMSDMAIKAVAACGLDFGAVDLFVDTNDNVYVLEVNSDPGMPGIIGYIYASTFWNAFNIDPPEYYFINHRGGITELPEDEKIYLNPPKRKRKKINAKEEDFSYRNEGVKMKK